MSYRYGNNSILILSTVNKYLRMTAFAVIAESVIDISIPKTGGLRTAKEQNVLFVRKVSKADGYKKLSKHQLKDDEDKGKALDLIAYVNGKKSWNRERAVYIITLFLKNFNRLKSEGKIPKNIYLHVGMFWRPDKDNGNSMGWDTFHVEIRNKPQKNIFV